VEQQVTRGNLVFGESTGTADQEFQLPATAVEPETLRLEVEEAGGWVPWDRVEDLTALDRDAAAARDARVFQLDAHSGVVRFGDGVRGRIPPTGSRLRAAQIRSGGGVAGNLPPGTLKGVTANTLAGESVGGGFEVAQPLPLVGGAEAETLAEAEGRIPARLRHRERAVTVDDYRVLARETPGAAVGRVELLPRFKPQQRDHDIPGIVTVMALPDRPFAPAPNPRADRPFLEAVHAWLDPRRPLGTELYVIGCEYLPVAVTVAVTVTEGAQPGTVLDAVRQALRRVLWPLAAGGFDGQGWPLGRGLSNRELAVEVARVPGVSEVGGLNLFRRQSGASGWQALGDARNGREQNLSLQRWQLPELLGVLVVADGIGTAGGGAPLTFSELGTNPFADDHAIAVPVVPDLC
jgi:predicted phage baseplate assembly protein